MASAAQKKIERRATLALSFQELFTAITRLRFNRQNVPDADKFRAQMREAIRMAAQDAASKGYATEDIRMATFAVVAFLDESVLNSRNPALATWSRLPLQEELFGHHMAGETFFQNVQELLGRRDSAETVDVLEVFSLCMLLGYRGRYGLGGGGELRSIMESVKDKVRRVRGANLPLSPAWSLPGDAPAPPKTDPWMKKLVVLAGVMFLIAVLTYAGCGFALISGASEVHAAAGNRNKNGNRALEIVKDR